MSHLDSYGVFGNPIAHSLSPQIHSAFAKQTGQAISYRAIKAPVDGFAQSALCFFQQGGLGANVTLPFKLDAFRLADRLSNRAKLAGAVNTLTVQDGQILGDNTDGAGLVFDLQRHLEDLTAATVLLIGAGGAARGAIGALFEAGVAHVFLSNRTMSKADSLVQDFSALGSLSVVSVNEVANISADIVINSTSSSLSGNLPELPPAIFNKAKLSYDMFYQKEPTTFLRWAAQHNTEQQLVDGLGMLVAQAAKSFQIWTGFEPKIQPVMDQIRAQMA